MTAELLTPADYEILAPDEQDAICQEILAEVRLSKFVPAGPAGLGHWNEVWATSQAVPPYIRPASILRVDGQFVRPKDPWLENRWYGQFRIGILQTYFQDVKAIYEFGCGNGWNLTAARRLYPEKKLMGLDWAESAVTRLPPGIHGQVFDFFQPNYDLKLAPGSGVWTVGALEQTGKDWGAFLEYLLANRPVCCLHVEPIVEWYDSANPVDLTAIAYHRVRKYWEGFPAKITELAHQGKVGILEQKRSFFGSRYLEGYSLISWRPT